MSVLRLHGDVSGAQQPGHLCHACQESTRFFAALLVVGHVSILDCPGRQARAQ
ncbi:hypothetical protein [Streptomyces sp. NPDC007355]|uniref:hypothetical protein n=1 Tax=Streptomyces sp. NPDC007355 TaxID=3364778 RepID=UPI0036B5EF98